MWPYWMDGTAASTVRNSLTCDSMFLLTGGFVYGSPSLPELLHLLFILGANAGMGASEDPFDELAALGC